MNQNPTHEQEERWQSDIADLVETVVYPPPVERVGAVFSLGDSVKVWKVKLSDGRIGWARQQVGYDGSGVYYYLPQDIALLSEIKWLIASGYSQEWARNPESRESGVWIMCASDLLSISPEKFAELKAEVDEIEATNPGRASKYRRSNQW